MIPSKFMLGDVDEFAKQAKEMAEYLKALGALWDRHRAGVLDGGTLDVQMIAALDEIGSTYICEMVGCLQRCYSDWDFCLDHGIQQQPAPGVPIK